MPVGLAPRTQGLSLASEPPRRAFRRLQPSVEGWAHSDWGAF